MNNHVPKKSTCKKLQELGVELNTEFVWWWNGDEYEIKLYEDVMFRSEPQLPAPLLSEILAALPDGTSMRKTHINDAKHEIWTSGVRKNITDDTAVEAAAQLLIWLVENNHVNPDES